MCALCEEKNADSCNAEKSYNEDTERGKGKAGGQIAQSKGGEVG